MHSHYNVIITLLFLPRLRLSSILFLSKLATKISTHFCYSTSLNKQKERSNNTFSTSSTTIFVSYCHYIPHSKPTSFNIMYAAGNWIVELDFLSACKKFSFVCSLISYSNKMKNFTRNDILFRRCHVEFIVTYEQVFLILYLRAVKEMRQQLWNFYSLSTDDQQRYLEKVKLNFPFLLVTWYFLTS